jgi:hypothetical protein
VVVVVVARAHVLRGGGSPWAPYCLLSLNLAASCEPMTQLMRHRVYPNLTSLLIFGFPSEFGAHGIWVSNARGEAFGASIRVVVFPSPTGYMLASPRRSLLT